MMLMAPPPVTDPAPVEAGIRRVGIHRADILIAGNADRIPQAAIIAISTTGYHRHGRNATGAGRAHGANDLRRRRAVSPRLAPAQLSDGYFSNTIAALS
jgi:hypothetical protein